MTTISFSVEDDIKKSFDKWAKRAKKSKSDIFRDMVRTYEFEETLDEIQQKAAPILKELGIETEDQLYEYLESDEAYEDRVRHQRLSSRNQKG
jgi:hypothetical protein